MLAGALVCVSVCGLLKKAPFPPTAPDGLPPRPGPADRTRDGPSTRAETAPAAGHGVGEGAVGAEAAGALHGLVVQVGPVKRRHGPHQAPPGAQPQGGDDLLLHLPAGSESAANTAAGNHATAGPAAQVGSPQRPRESQRRASVRPRDAGTCTACRTRGVAVAVSAMTGTPLNSRRSSASLWYLQQRRAMSGVALHNTCNRHTRDESRAPTPTRNVLHR